MESRGSSLPSPDEVRSAIEELCRAEYGRLLAHLIGVLRDFESAEEALQEALAQAWQSWPAEGLPARPGAWVLTTARRRGIDEMRRRRRRGTLLLDPEALPEQAASEPSTMVRFDDSLPSDDDLLRLVFTCCHPALSEEAQVGLTLNALCGLSAREIGRAFLVSESTMAQRLVRAKRKIRAAGIPYRIPPHELLAERLPAVLAIVYLVFNEGYSASGGAELVRRELCAQALHLGAELVRSMPDEPEVLALQALLLLHDARRDARAKEDGELVLLEEQDRSLWRSEGIERGRALLERAMQGSSRGRPGPYLLQAAIAALHAEAARAEETDWPQILGLYDALLREHPTPIVALNRAVALAEVAGPAEGLAALSGLADALRDYPYYEATRADFLRRLGDRDAARSAYERALALCQNASEARFLRRRLAELDSPPGAEPRGGEADVRSALDRRSDRPHDPLGAAWCSAPRG